MLEKLQFQQLVEEHVTIRRVTSSRPGFRFVLAMVLALYVGFSRLNHLQFLQREPMLTRILEVDTLPVQSTFWRFLTSLHLTVARQLLELSRHLCDQTRDPAVGLPQYQIPPKQAEAHRQGCRLLQTLARESFPPLVPFASE